MSKKDIAKSDISFLSLLTLMFIYLKLTHQIDWSWIVVLMPLWIIPVGVGITVVLMAILARIFGGK